MSKHPPSKRKGPRTTADTNTPPKMLKERGVKRSASNYPDRKQKQQVLSANAAEELMNDDTFEGIDCSLIEREAIISLQSDTRNSQYKKRNLAWKYQ